MSRLIIVHRLSCGRLAHAVCKKTGYLWYHQLYHALKIRELFRRETAFGLRRWKQRIEMTKCSKCGRRFPRGVGSISSVNKRAWSSSSCNWPRNRRIATLAMESPISTRRTEVPTPRLARSHKILWVEPKLIRTLIKWRNIQWKSSRICIYSQVPAICTTIPPCTGAWTRLQIAMTTGLGFTREEHLMISTLLTTG